MNEAGAQAPNEDRRTLKPLAMIYAQRHVDGSTEPPIKSSEPSGAKTFTENELNGDKSLYRGYRNPLSGSLIMPVRFIADYEKNQSRFVFLIGAECMIFVHAHSVQNPPAASKRP